METESKRQILGSPNRLSTRYNAFQPSYPGHRFRGNNRQSFAL